MTSAASRQKPSPAGGVHVQREAPLLRDAQPSRCIALSARLALRPMAPSPWVGM